MRFWGSAIGVVMVASAAHAASDKPIFAPPAAWVKPATLPADTAAKGDAPVRILLQDQQVHFADGVTTTYAETAYRIQTAQGMAAATVSFPWNPDLSTLTIHKLQIRRGDKVIDVLANQQFTVLRREQNLENAMLDGVLTATLQPEGLQVGDILDFAVSITRADPALKGHYESVAGGWGALPSAAVRFSADWPQGTVMQTRERGQLPALAISTSDKRRTASLSVDDVQPVVSPQGAPARFAQTRLVELSDFKSWADLSALMAPLYTKASTLPAGAALDAEIARIAAASSDPKMRAAAALSLVQDRVRYVFLGMNDGGLVPADAETTWERRFGDCKGKTALLLALLHGLGIPAEPALANSDGADGLDQYLPMAAWFNHVLVRATIGGRVYWLDGTRTGDGDIDSIRTPAFDWVLPIEPKGAGLERLVQQPLDVPDTETVIRIDASAGLSAPAPAHVETMIRGDIGQAWHLQMAPLVGSALDDALRQYWRGQYNFIDVKTASARWDAATRTETLVMDGTAKMDWSKSYYETDGTSLGYNADFSRSPGPDADAPFKVGFPSYDKTTEIIALPGKGVGFTFYKGADVDETIAGVAYHRTASMKDGVATIAATTRALQPEFPAADASAAQTALRALYKQSVYIYEPNNYRPTAKEVAAQMATAPTTAQGFIDRGNMLLDTRRYPEAIADFDSAVKLDPKSEWAFANRGMAHAWLQQFDLAEQDFAKAAAINPNNYVVDHGRGMIAFRKGDMPDAIAAFDKALVDKPDDDFARSYRANALLQAGRNREALADAERLIANGVTASQTYVLEGRIYRALGDIDKAIVATDKAISGNPHDADAYVLQANNFHDKGDRARSLAQADALIAANPNDPVARRRAGAIYHANGEKAKAMTAFDEAIALEPTSEAYLTRLYDRDKSDLAGRKADAAAALKLDPDRSEAIVAMAQVDEDSGNTAGAIALLAKALKAAPKDVGMLVARGMAYARSGDETRAGQDYAAARALVTNPMSLNNMCWDKATAGVSLPSALADCDAALAKAPNEAAAQDSRGFALLRLGRYAEAIKQYDAALAIRPNQAQSLYGRAIAEARSGDATAASRDAAAARKAQPSVVDEFKGYGVELDTSPAHASVVAASSAGGAQ
jgi:tetratricopeptide (TPR) repeat protein/transglutaminase-like putative cysteine protease